MLKIDDLRADEHSIPVELSSLAKAKNRHAYLTELIADLDKKVSQVGHNNELEFLTAYRVHQVNT